MFAPNRPQHKKFCVKAEGGLKLFDLLVRKSCVVFKAMQVRLRFSEQDGLFPIARKLGILAYPST